MNKTIFGLSALLLCSCSVMVKTPLTRFDSPETRGKQGGVDGYLAYQGRNEVELTSNTLVSAPNLDRPSVQPPGHRLMANGSVGLAEKFEISLTLPAARLGVKYQILGDSHDAATKGNIPLAVTSSISSVSEEEADISSTFKLKELVYDLALVSGYRINEMWLIYGGPFILWDDIKTNYRPSASAPSVDSSGKLTSYGANLGVEASLNQQGFVRAEFAGAKTTLGKVKSGRGTYGLALGMHF
ncbi:MAG: hypothetical protein ACXWQO_05715 [Bdellovibrionota bacterium]